MNRVPEPPLMKPPGPEIIPGQQSNRLIRLSVVKEVTLMPAVRCSVILPLQMFDGPNESKASGLVELSVSGSSRTQRLSLNVRVAFPLRMVPPALVPNARECVADTFPSLTVRVPVNELAAR